MLKLYSYFRSSAAYRVRIALNLKKLDYEIIPVHLVKDGGEQRKADYLRVNPQGLVPTLEDHGVCLTQSMAILDYLENKYTQPNILPSDPVLRAHALSLANIVACDIHPLDNLRVLQYLKHELEVSDEQKTDWYLNWIEKGFNAFDSILDKLNISEKYCMGTEPTIADICLIPQIYNAERFNYDTKKKHPRLFKIYNNCLSIDAFDNATPEKQIDAS